MIQPELDLAVQSPTDCQSFARDASARCSCLSIIEGTLSRAQCVLDVMEVCGLAECDSLVPAVGSRGRFRLTRAVSADDVPGGNKNESQ